jgi:hypothetical protein
MRETGPPRLRPGGAVFHKQYTARARRSGFLPVVSRPPKKLSGAEDSFRWRETHYLTEAAPTPPDER